VVSRDLLIRTVRNAAEFGDFLNISEQAFGETTSEEDIARFRTIIRDERSHAAFDGGLLIGTAGAYDFTLTVPGGEVAAAGITMVGVLPTHRRRGVLRSLMRAQLDDVRKRGEPVAILWASEPAIYGRFGYGLAARAAFIDADRDHAEFRAAPDVSARVRLVPPDEAYEIVAPVYDDVRRRTPGFFARTEAWWRNFKLADLEAARDGAGPLFVAVLELDGEAVGYARYAIESKWEDGMPAGRLVIKEAHAISPRATRELWRFLFGVDLVTRVKVRNGLAVDHPLFLMVVDPRRLRTSIGDALWLRIVDVEAAFAARSYAADERVVLELGDAFCKWNAGRWELTAEGARRTRATPELRLTAEELGAVYLGGFTCAELAAADRVEELREGALARADALLRTDTAPWCPEVF
jgi:predicted acetyltransferase